MNTIFSQSSSKLSIICGPMFSSKTSTLIIELTRYADIDIPVLFINSKDDTRGKMYSTHNSSLSMLSEKVKTIKVKELQDVPDEKINQHLVFGIDECQFFPDLVPFVKMLLFMKKIIYIAGLDGDSNQRLFGSFYELIPYATEVRKLNAVCENCKRIGKIVPAGVTIRKDHSHSKDVKEIGGKETYIPVCNDCLFEESNPKEKSITPQQDPIEKINYLI